VSGLKFLRDWRIYRDFAQILIAEASTLFAAGDLRRYLFNIFVAYTYYV
jgi:hypothetical protein